MNLKNTPFSIVMHELILFVALIKHFGRLACGCEWGQVRKVCQSIAFLAPAACLAIASAKLNVNPQIEVAVLATGIGLSSFTLAGLYCTYQDISPKYAGILLGLTCTAGAIPGALGVALVGIIFDHTHSWNLALFAPSIFFYLTGFMVWNLCASSEPQNFTS
jgi:ACS family sodium-dependent inorganic phosphate cotransporter